MPQWTSKILLVRLTANRNAFLFLIRVTSCARYTVWFGVTRNDQTTVNVYFTLSTITYFDWFPLHTRRWKLTILYINLVHILKAVSARETLCWFAHHLSLYWEYTLRAKVLIFVYFRNNFYRVSSFSNGCINNFRDHYCLNAQRKSILPAKMNQILICDLMYI